MDSADAMSDDDIPLKDTGRITYPRRAQGVKGHKLKGFRAEDLCTLPHGGET